MQRLFSNLGVLAAVLALPLLAQNDAALKREGQYWVRTVTRVIDAPVLAIHVESVGNVAIRGEAKDRASYTLKARVKARDAKQAEALLRLIEAKVTTARESVSLSVAVPPHFSEDPELSLSVPRRLREARIATRRGSVQAWDLDGALDARTSGGRIAVDGIRGRAHLRTGGGDIQVGNVAGPVLASSGGGAIRVQSAGGESSFQTAGGDILLHHIGGALRAATAGGNIRIDRALGSVFARTAGGLIQVQQADGFVTAESSGGAIHVNAATGVQCDSNGGAIRLRNVAGGLQAATNAGSIIAELQRGHPLQESTLSTGAGDITVIIPSNVAVTIVARNASPGVAGRIISDFAEIRVQNANQPGGIPLVAEGALNGGGPVLHLNAMGGTIYLRRQK